MSGNMCIFIGRLARKPVRKDKGDSPRCYFTLLNSSSYKREDGSRDTYSVDFMVSGKRAIAMAQYQDVGDLIWVSAKYTPFKRKARGLNGLPIEDSILVDVPLFQVVEYQYLAPGKKKQGANISSNAEDILLSDYIEDYNPILDSFNAKFLDNSSSVCEEFN